MSVEKFLSVTFGIQSQFILFIFLFYNTSACDKPLGMESGAIKDKQIRQSSFYNANYMGKAARLNNKQYCWMASPSDRRAYLHIDLGRQSTVTSVAAQGRHKYAHYVTKYLLLYVDGRYLKYYREGGKP